MHESRKVDFNMISRRSLLTLLSCFPFLSFLKQKEMVASVPPGRQFIGVDWAKPGEESFTITYTYCGPPEDLLWLFNNCYKD